MKGIRACLLLGIFVAFSSIVAEGTVHVLCYHTFLGRSSEYDVNPSDFRKQVAEIDALGYRFVRTEDVLAGNVSGDHNVWLTIDDGNASVNSIYASVLKPRGIKPLFFIYPGVIDNPHAPYALKYQELRQFLGDGVTIGAHGYFHLYLDDKHFNKDRKASLKEIYDSREVLEKKLGRKMNLFAYPFGLYSDAARDEIRKAGYQYAFTIEFGVVQLPLERNAEPLKLPRYMVTKSSWRSVRQILENDVRNRGKIGSRIHRDET